jgi:hypothetical protein
LLLSGCLLRDPGLVGQGLGAVFPVVVVGIVADLLVQLLLGFKIVGLANVHCFFRLRVGWLGSCHDLFIYKLIVNQLQVQ